MKPLLSQLANELPADALLLQNGIEKEHLRVDATTGMPALGQHPAAFGASLTNPLITTDFSENLLEMVTPPVSAPAILSQLTQLNRFITTRLDHELLWPLSMPGEVGDINAVREAEYGNSNIARMKHIYRVGLTHRYGKMMQLIAGLHFNASFQPALLQTLQTLAGNTDPFSIYASARYMRLVRCFYCHYPLLAYLFGASPTCTPQSLVHGVPGYLQQHGPDTYFGPYATSLRMSDLGYHNPSQNAVKIDLSSVTAYADSLTAATREVYPAYKKLGVQSNGQYRQLNANWLQIENEYYSPIRPKQITQSGERPTQALRKRGVAYIEVRAIDLNPLHPVGVDETQIRFLNLFLLWCLLSDDHCLSPQDCCDLRGNFHTVVTQGRKPDITIRWSRKNVPLTQWLQCALDKLQPLAEWLDTQLAQTAAVGYQTALQQQLAKVHDADMTPSAQVLAQMQDQRLSHHEYGFNVARQQSAWLQNQPADPALVKAFEQAAQTSIQQWQAIEAEVQPPFETFLAQYFNQG